jgi:hypothetical protein
MNCISLQLQLIAVQRCNDATTRLRRLAVAVAAGLAHPSWPLPRNWPGPVRRLLRRFLQWIWAITGQVHPAEEPL